MKNFMTLLQKGGSTKNLLPAGGGQRKFTAKGGRGLWKISEFCPILTHPPSDIKWTFPYIVIDWDEQYSC